MNCDASIVITTRNRCQDLVRAVASACAQTGCTTEVLVFDDCSEDETCECIARDFPKVRLFPSGQRSGYIGLRNRGFREAQASVVVSIDDDAYFASPTTIAEALAFLSDHSQCAAVALNYVEPLPVGRAASTCLLEQGAQVRSYVGTAHAIRRDIALAMGGYCELLVHQGEERDLCLRMLAAGHTINHVATPALVHCVSPTRDLSRMHRYGSRNLLLFDFMYAPNRYLLPIMFSHCLKMLRYRFSPGRCLATLGHIARAVVFCATHHSLRTPLSRGIFRQWYALPPHGPTHIPAPTLPPPIARPLPEAPPR